MRAFKSSLYYPFFILSVTLFFVLVTVNRGQFLRFETVALTIQNTVCLMLVGLCLLLFFYHYKQLTFDNKALIITTLLNPFKRTVTIDLTEAKKYKLDGHELGFTIQFYFDNNGIEKKKEIMFDIPNKHLDYFIDNLKQLNIQATDK